MSGPPPERDAPFSATLQILNQRGLHARAAAKFVKTAGVFDADIAVERAGQSVSGLSIMGLMMLAASPGSEIDITCTGQQAAEALDALSELVSNKFEEE
ncbi:MAG: HPr family phosphocarrier protein [Rhodospirillaceae bacterium]|nr:HPr family phosphocarrier protein [Rhodospirillaceae bacterium]